MLSSSLSELERAELAPNVSCIPSVPLALLTSTIASADRRPVDPPPIVDLQIWEGTGEDKKDVTFSHQANFFLYTTLEPARPMNQGRVPVSTTTLPVLTGTPVAGMAYLDRPKQAGYFIFPDLSVRHEGKYRLSFNLYEELKHPEKDADLDASVPSPPRDSNGSASGSKNFVHYRLEVKSGPFNVFSAKRFPGLAESTNLSRMVNEQGCRVRIRRDVRMRRRDKASNMQDDDPVDGSYAASDRLQTPQQTPDRPRSISNASGEVASLYNSNRRPSVHEVGYYQNASYQQQPPPSAIPQSATSYNSFHLSFGGSHTPQYQTPTMPAPPAPLYPSHQQNSQNYAYAPPTHARQLSGPASYTYPNQPPQQASYIPPAHMEERHDRHDTDTRRYSGPSFPGERQYSDPSRRLSGGTTPTRQSFPTAPYQYSHTPIQPYPATVQARSLTPLDTNPPMANSSMQLPPIKAVVASSMEPSPTDYKTSASTVPYGPQNPYSNSHYMSQYQQPQGYTSNPHSATSAPASAHTKRSHAQTFDQAEHTVPLPNHARPIEALIAQDIRQIETQDGELVDDDSYENIGLLSYQRADGRRETKKCPSPKDR